ncbi:MAG: dinitrogenase iron-molybdenum cofactor biosynthesis protein [Clostridia bacterium]|nr:dinitrogenase iron-molybdenum cofactor biosynthesis protein [Clostridia bacterium]
MKIAVTYENGQIFQHFGHTEQFKIYTTKDGKVIHSVVIDTNGSGHGALAGLLSALGVDALICGGIGGGAQAALANAGIKLYGGVSGSPDAAVEALLDGTLGFDPNVKCDHHDHHGEGHTCGDHGCGHHGSENGCH